MNWVGGAAMAVFSHRTNNMILEIFLGFHGLVRKLASYKRLYFLGLFVMAGRLVTRVCLNIWNMFE
jgi:hypothetical protein